MEGHSQNREQHELRLWGQRRDRVSSENVGPTWGAEEEQGCGGELTDGLLGLLSPSDPAWARRGGNPQSGRIYLSVVMVIVAP